MNFCVSCFRKIDDAQEKCPFCGSQQDIIPKEKFHLAPKTVLKNRYLLGTVCGSGGFGITYKALDMQLNEIVAVKELFPSGMVQRVPGEKEIIIFESKRKDFEREKDHFLLEARTMAKFPDNSNIVNVYNFFEENNTAYIVMEFLDGISLKDYLKQCGGKLDFESSMEITKEILNGLKEVHKIGIVHRDISADNVMLTLNNKIKLFDFGAARLSSEDDKTRTIVVKKGYAPPEQYRQKSKQGAYTDVYATGATMYQMLTGILPPESVDRVSSNEELIPPSKIVPDIPKYIDNVLMRAMAIKPDLRFKNADEFLNALSNKKEVLTPEKELKKRKIRRRVLVSFIAILILITSCFSFVKGYGESNFQITNTKESIRVLMVRPDGVPKENDEKVRDEIINNYRTYMQGNKFKKSGDFSKGNIIIDFATPEEYMKKLYGDSQLEKYDVYVSDYETDDVFVNKENMEWAAKKLQEVYPSSIFFFENNIPTQFDTDVLYINYSLFNCSKEEALAKVRENIKNIKSNGYAKCVIDPNSDSQISFETEKLKKEEINNINARITGDAKKELTSEECSKLFESGKLEAYIGKYSQKDFDRKNIKNLLIVPVNISSLDSFENNFENSYLAIYAKQKWCIRPNLTKNQKFMAMYFICCMANANTQQMLSAYGYSEYLPCDKSLLERSSIDKFILDYLNVEKV